MKRLWSVLVAAALLGVVLALPRLYHAGASSGEDGKPKVSGKYASPAEIKALGEASLAFAAAVEKGDIDALAALWTEDAEYTHESGKVYRGRKNIRALLEKALAGFKGHKQTTRIHEVRFIRPDVVLQEGSTISTSPEGAVSVGRFSAVLAKQDGKWLLESVRDLTEPDEDDKPAAYQRLKQLSFLVGEWQDKAGKGGVQVSCKWGPGQTFLLQEVTVKQEDGTALSMSQRVGWDAHNENIRSWVFDSTGSFGGGTWSREGNTWTVQSEGVYADGRLGNSVDSWKFVDSNNVVWGSKSRQADEQPLPDVEMALVRKPKGP